MNINEKFYLSYGFEEKLEDKIERLEKLTPETYFKLLGFGKNNNRYAKNYPLFHGIRFDGINKLESIFQNKYVLCGKKCPNRYTSIDETIHYLNINSMYTDNCNKGEYVSVIPHPHGHYDLEFDTFVRENLFLAFNGNIDAYETYYLKYDDYCKLLESNKELNNLYSYALNEYMAKDKISLDELLYVGVDSSHYNENYHNSLNNTIEKVIELLKYYKIDVPFIDIKNNEVIYENNKKIYQKYKQ